MLDAWQPDRVFTATRPHVLSYRAPYDWPSMRAWLAARSIPGVELVSDEGYARTARLGDAFVVVQVRHRPAIDAFEMTVDASAPIDPQDVSSRVRRVLDLDRDASSVLHLSGDPQLASALARHPGLRVPGGWDPFELAVRAILGQQVTVVAARQLAGALVGTCGVRLPVTLATAALATTFPSARDLQSASLDALRMPGARKATLRALAAAALDEPALLDGSRSLDDIIVGLRGVKGIGDWTAQYVALRALRAPDAFPASDVGLLRGAARVFGERPSPAALLARADAWRPHRAYAAQLLWAEDGDA